MPDPKNRNLIAERDKRARAERAGGMKRTGGGNKPVRRSEPTRPGRETTTAGQDQYDSVEDRWARLTGTGRYANTPEMNWARMTGTGEFADGGSAEDRLNRQRMFGAADMQAQYRAGAPARRERALGGMADLRAEQRPSVGRKLASRTAKAPVRKQRRDDEYVNPAFRNRTAFPNMGG
jgi:hypothetical protein